MNGDFVYRFRSMGHLFGNFNELEKQTIYFSSPDKLNDPIEGFNDIIWQGDDVVWRSLLNHYLICLTLKCSHMSLAGEKTTIDRSIHVFHNFDTLPTDSFRDIVTDIRAQLFKEPVIEKMFSHFGNLSRPLRRNELRFFLSIIHRVALARIIKTFQARGLIDNGLTGPLAENATHALRSLDQYISIKDSELEMSKIPAGSEVIHGFFKSFDSQLSLLTRLMSDGRNFTNHHFVFQDFPSVYIENLERLIFPEWYVACFTKNFTNPVMWGHYCEGHRGICLKFKTHIHEGKPCLNLTALNSVSSSRGGPIEKHHNVVRFELHDVDYEPKYVELNFFRMLGRLSVQSIQKHWYTDDRGKRSALASDFAATDEWRKKYWSHFTAAVTTKLNEWKYEGETRLINSGIVITKDDDDDRTATYKLQDLDGIIFGMKMSEEHKVRVIKLMLEKCEKESYKDLKFYQADYSHVSGKMEILELRDVSPDRLRKDSSAKV